MSDVPRITVRLWSGQRREFEEPDWRERHDPRGDEIERIEREDRKREKEPQPWSMP